jgi:hypothetical protein
MAVSDGGEPFRQRNVNPHAPGQRVAALTLCPSHVCFKGLGRVRPTDVLMQDHTAICAGDAQWDVSEYCIDAAGDNLPERIQANSGHRPQAEAVYLLLTKGCLGLEHIPQFVDTIPDLDPADTCGQLQVTYKLAGRQHPRRRLCVPRLDLACVAIHDRRVVGDELLRKCRGNLEH